MLEVVQMQPQLTEQDIENWAKSEFMYYKYLVKQKFPKMKIQNDRTTIEFKTGNITIAFNKYTRAVAFMKGLVFADDLKRIIK